MASPGPLLSHWLIAAGSLHSKSCLQTVTRKAPVGMQCQHVQAQQAGLCAPGVSKTGCLERLLPDRKGIVRLIKEVNA